MLLSTAGKHVDSCSSVCTAAGAKQGNAERHTYEVVHLSGCVSPPVAVCVYAVVPRASLDLVVLAVGEEDCEQPDAVQAAAQGVSAAAQRTHVHALSARGPDLMIVVPT